MRRPATTMLYRLYNDARTTRDPDARTKCVVDGRRRPRVRSHRSFLCASMLMSFIVCRRAFVLSTVRLRSHARSCDRRGQPSPALCFFSCRLHIAAL